MQNIEIPAELAIKLLSTLLSDKYKNPNLIDLVDSNTLQSDELMDYISELENITLKVSDINDTLKQIRADTKELLTQDVLKALKFLRGKIGKTTETYDSIVLLTARYNRILKYFNKNLIDFQASELEIAKIENAILHIVNNLNDSDIS
jgi:hypothetical protein